MYFSFVFSTVSVQCFPSCHSRKHISIVCKKAPISLLLESAKSAVTEKLPTSNSHAIHIVEPSYVSTELSYQVKAPGIFQDRKSIVWFRWDLRLHDNPSLTHAIKESAQLLPVYVLEEMPKEPALNNNDKEKEDIFLISALADLKKSLQRCHSDLIILASLEEMVHLARDCGVDFIYYHRSFTKTGIDQEDALHSLLTHGNQPTKCCGFWSNTLHSFSDIPVSLNKIPKDCLQYEKLVDQTVISEALASPSELPPLIPHQQRNHHHHHSQLPELTGTSATELGESKALEIVNNLALRPDQKLERYLSLGCLSPKYLWEAVSTSLSRFSLKRACVYSELIWNEFQKLTQLKQCGQTQLA